MFPGIVIGHEGLCRCAHQSIGAAELTEHAGSALARFWTTIRFMPLIDFLDVGQEVDGVLPVTIEKIFADGEFSRGHGRLWGRWRHGSGRGGLGS